MSNSSMNAIGRVSNHSLPVRLVDGALVAVTETSTRRDGTLAEDPSMVSEAGSAPRGGEARR